MALLRTQLSCSRWMQRAIPLSDICSQQSLASQIHHVRIACRVDDRAAAGHTLQGHAECIHWMYHGKRSSVRAMSAGSNSSIISSSSLADVDDSDSEAQPASTVNTVAKPQEKPLRVERLLANLGYGKRQECTAMIKRRRLVYAATGTPAKVGEKAHASELLLDGEPLDPPPPLNIILHKPVGYVVTSPDDENVSDPKVYDLLPYRFGRRKPFLSSIGRLDKETSGLLLLTDDGQLLHSIQSPVRGIWKVYIAELESPLEGKQAEAAIRRFASGRLQLQGDRTPLLPASLRMLGLTTAEVAICEGRYHQIRRMFAALGHHVVGLHRQAIGGLTLSDTGLAVQDDGSSSSSGDGREQRRGVVDLAEGEWRYASAAEMAAVLAGPDLQDSILQGQQADDDDTELVSSRPGQRQQQSHVKQKQREVPVSSISSAVPSSTSDNKQHGQPPVRVSQGDAAWYAALAGDTITSSSSSNSSNAAVEYSLDSPDYEEELDEPELIGDQLLASKRYRDSTRWARKRATIARGVLKLRQKQQQQDQ